MKNGLRIVGILAMAFAVAHCGDSDVRVTTDGGGVRPSPGTFTGTLSDGGSIRIEVGSIEEVVFDCDDEQIQETFSPPREINDDGTFSVKFSDGGRDFHVTGTFRDNNTVDGEINDEDNHCDVSYDAFRGTGGTTATPARTPTGVGPTPTSGGEATATAAEGPTATPGEGATSTPGGGPTFTPGGGVVTATPGPGGATKTATPGPAGSPCPEGVEVIGNAGSQRVLDTGWTGIAHNQTVIQDGKLTFTVSGCQNAVRPCGVCNVGGPVQNLKADQGDINAHRCSNDTSIKCTDNSACGSGTCVFYFGAPLPLAAGGVSTCVTNQINGAVSGTANIETGTFESNLTLTSRVYSAIETAIPCPVCNGDATVNDGQKGGMCSGGTKNGQPCDGNGRSPVESFGTTSLDCPPNPGALIATLPIVFNGSSGTETIELTANSPGCSAAPGKKCFCPAEQQTTKPNGCVDTTETAADGSLCQPKGGSQTEGTCPESVALHCQIQDFLGCLADSDCPAPGDSCVTEPTPCYLDNGVVGGKVLAIGMADPPTNGEADPTLAALFCVGRTSSSGVNSAAGLPGLGRIELPIHSKEILALP